MKKTMISLCVLLAGLTAGAQNADPVLMTVNGKPVTKSEFEYSYNKNSNIAGAVEKKTVAEYAEMYLNYKLKVAAAEAERLDTLESFRNEFLQYRDMQLTPMMVDSAYIDSVAHSVYDATVRQLDGHDMLRTAHILLFVRQNATEAEAAAVKSRIDSIYNALVSGADFAEIAKKISEDRGSATKGGELPWIGPGMTLPEYEQAAYSLKAGEMSKPVKSSVGWHVVKMLERKSLDSYETLRADILQALKRQGIEERSAEARIAKIAAASNGKLDREAVLDSVLASAVKNDNDLKNLVQEYYDGLLLYEVSKRTVWDKVAEDTPALETQFKAHKDKYVWTEPRFKGYVVLAKDKKSLKKALSVLKKNVNGDWRKALKTEVNKGGVVARVNGPLLVKKGENKWVDGQMFGEAKPEKNAQFSEVKVWGKKLKNPKDYTDVKSQVVSDVQQEAEEKWVESLRSRFPHHIDKAVLSTVKEQ